MSDLEKEEVKKEDVGNWKNILKIILILVVGCIAGWLSFSEVKKLDKDANKEEIKEENNKTNDENSTDEDASKEESDVKEDEVDEVLPIDEELIARSKVLKDNFNDLLSGGFECDAKEYTFEELNGFVVYKIKNQTEISNLINDTFADSTAFAKYIPYFEKNGVYYTANGSGGLMGAGYYIFEYTVKNKTLTTANVSIDYIECYDEEIHDKISACKNNPWGYTSNITLNLVNVNGKWLISSLDADIAQGLIK